ncbi:VOC family protein [Streptomyces sp. NPDC050636]|uniref:VOC family protein n=1 Tax=Streptomyces sp. NPDC050636 TaxID=3154510 RepID=UPI003442E955
MTIPSPGSVAWFEIDTADPKAAQDFYGTLLGWTFQPVPAPDGRTYTLITVPGDPYPTGGIRPTGTGGEEGITVSMVSTDAAADVARLKDLGATVVLPPAKAADGGDYARLKDTRGNLFTIWTPPVTSWTPPEQSAGNGAGRQSDQRAGAPQPGSFAWFEIGTADIEATKNFYAEAFGWTYQRDPGAVARPYYGVTTGGERSTGGLSDNSAEAVVAEYAIPLFLSLDVPATVAKAQSLGATVEFGPETTTYGLAFARLKDPRGVSFGLFSMPQG